MQSSLQTEVTLCSNCKEEVPKTLYCLNCGYPLYKDELKKQEPEVEGDVVVEVAPEPFSVEPLVRAAAGEASLGADGPSATPVVSEVVEADVGSDAVSEAVEQIEVVESPVSEVTEEHGEPSEEELPPEEEAFEEVETAVIDEGIMGMEPKETEVMEDVAEESVSEVANEHGGPLEKEVTPEEKTVEEVENVVIDEDVVGVEPDETEVVEVVEKVVKDVAEEPVIEVIESVATLVPDPVIREVMENFAKNISMKIRLVGLLRDKEVKAETFEKLFDSYVARGEMLMNSRNEMLERVRFDLGSRERALNEAVTGLEELGIRRAIGDVSEEEYGAKSPGFEWDIGHYKDDVARKKAEIAYLGDLSRVMSAGEIEELRKQGEGCYDSVDGLADSGVVGAEMAGRMKVALEEAITCLNASV